MTVIINVCSGPIHQGTKESMAMSARKWQETRHSNTTAGATEAGLAPTHNLLQEPPARPVLGHTTGRVLLPPCLSSSSSAQLFCQAPSHWDKHPQHGPHILQRHPLIAPSRALSLHSPRSHVPPNISAEASTVIRKKAQQRTNPKAAWENFVHPSPPSCRQQHNHMACQPPDLTHTTKQRLLSEAKDVSA